MRVLFSPVFDFAHLAYHRTMAEYMGDSIFSGLRSLLGPDVVDTPRLWHMYAADKVSDPVRFDRLWGRGFTLYGLLGDDSGVDRDEIDAKVASGFFDLVVVTVHCTAGDPHQSRLVEEHIGRLAAHYPRSKIAFIDTLDSSSFCYDGIRPKVTYFKRELANNVDAHPVSFSIPKEKFVATPQAKTQDFGTCVPTRPSTYVFEREADYYADYQRSRFGYTCKKGGWDTMRHYEILANGSVPYFAGLAECPVRTLFRFPKALCLEAMNLSGVAGLAINHEVFDSQAYADLNARLFEYARAQLTTEAMAKYVLDTMLG